MKCQHEKIVISDDIDKAKIKETVSHCFNCSKAWTKKQWIEYLKEKN